MTDIDKLVAEYQNLVSSIARSYARSGVPVEDLIQEGMIGLLEANKKYDPAKQTKFSTYAVFWIKKYILSAIEREHHQGSGNSDLPDNYLEQVADPSPEPQSDAILQEEKLILPADLPALEAKVLRLSFEQQKTIKEISLLLCLSPERIKQIRQKALRRIRITKS
jgi:RNA polymerase sigma factor (sigma-70 family)